MKLMTYWCVVRNYRCFRLPWLQKYPTFYINLVPIIPVRYEHHQLWIMVVRSIIRDDFNPFRFTLHCCKYSIKAICSKPGVLGSIFWPVIIHLNIKIAIITILKYQYCMQCPTRFSKKFFFCFTCTFFNTFIL